MDTANLSGTCQFAIFIAPVERETITKHVWWDQENWPWSSSWYHVPPYPQMLQDHYRNEVSRWRIPQQWRSPCLSNLESNLALCVPRRHASLLPEVKSSLSQMFHFSKDPGEITTRMWFWKQRLTVCQLTKGDATQAEVMICQSTPGLIPQGMCAFCGIKWRRR